MHWQAWEVQFSVFPFDFQDPIGRHFSFPLIAIRVAIFAKRVDPLHRLLRMIDATPPPCCATVPRSLTMLQCDPDEDADCDRKADGTDSEGILHQRMMDATPHDATLTIATRRRGICVPSQGGSRRHELGGVRRISA